MLSSNSFLQVQHFKPEIAFPYVSVAILKQETIYGDRHYQLSSCSEECELGDAS